MDSIRYVLALLVWATFPPTVLFWILVHGFIGPWRRSGGPAPTYLVVLPICLIFFGVLLRWNPVAETDLGMNWSVFGAGFAIWVAAWALERRVRMHMDFRTLAGVRELAWRAREIPRIPTMDEFIGDEEEGGTSPEPVASTANDDEDPWAPLPPPPSIDLGAASLVREGPYAHVRHPRALSTTIGLWGWAMMSNYTTSYVVAALFMPAMWIAIHLEDRELRNRFGEEWEAYAAEVPAFVPRRG